MFLKLLFCLVLINLTDSREINRSDEEYMDVVMDLLLNGEGDEFMQSSEDDDEDDPVLTAGVWKCGNCSDLHESKLIYSEINDVDTDISDDQPMDVQIGLALQDMRCVTVKSDVAGVVRRVSGSCSSGEVTLNVAMVPHFTVYVYGE